MSTNPNPGRDDLLTAAFKQLDQGEPTPASASSQQATPPTAESRTLVLLERSRRPNPKTVCEGCPNSVWFASPVEVRCYCRVMYLVTWSSKDPQQITACDGLFLGQDG